MTSKGTQQVVLALLGLGLLVNACSSNAGDSGGSDETTGSDGPNADGGSWIVTLGDSYISGEGTRWAGNTAGKPGPVDAQGGSAYFDKGSRESEPGCHRAQESIADVGDGLASKNLACSGATALSHFNGDQFKPGLDFFDDGSGHIGQALALQRFAAKHAVEAVVISVGGNDFGFSSLVTQCAADFITTTGRKPTLCRDDPAVRATFDPDNVATVSSAISDAIVRVAGAMQRAGYARDDYAITVMNYPAPIPPGDAIRYPETLAGRDTLGGCPVYDADATWAVQTALSSINQAIADAVDDAGFSNLGLLDVSGAFDGHRVCESGARQLTETGLKSWRDPQAAVELEWVNMAYTKAAPWQLQESFHPNYWGMLAERSCVRQLLEGAPADASTCTQAGDGLRGGEPTMTVSS